MSAAAGVFFVLIPRFFVPGSFDALRMPASAYKRSGAGRQRDELGLRMAPGPQVFPPGAEFVVHNKVRGREA